MAETVIKVQFTETADRNVPLPAYTTAGAAGADIRANLSDKGEIVIAPGARALIPTGLKMEIAPGYEVQVRPRSGLALKHGVTVLNTPGTIDSDYRGEVGVILINLGEMPFVVSHSDRIAQLIVAPVTQADLVSVEALADSARGAGGFGSTGQG